VDSPVKTAAYEVPVSRVALLQLAAIRIGWSNYVEGLTWMGAGRNATVEIVLAPSPGSISGGIWRNTAVLTGFRRIPRNSACFRQNSSGALRRSMEVDYNSRGESAPLRAFLVKLPGGCWKNA
jgi:hypothetical protein